MDASPNNVLSEASPCAKSKYSGSDLATRLQLLHWPFELKTQRCDFVAACTESPLSELTLYLVAVAEVVVLEGVLQLAKVGAALIEVVVALVDDWVERVKVVVVVVVVAVVVAAACVVEEEEEIVPAVVDVDDEDAEVDVAALAVVESLVETVASFVLNSFVEEIEVEVVVVAVVAAAAAAVGLVAADLVQAAGIIDHFHHRVGWEIVAPSTVCEEQIQVIVVLPYFVA